MDLPFAESYKIKMIEPLRRSTRENRYPDLEFLRLTIPRRVYTNNHMDYVAAALKNIYEKRKNIKSGLRIMKEAPIMRHFTVELSPAIKKAV